jgi:hypothetical protein
MRDCRAGGPAPAKNANHATPTNPAQCACDLQDHDMMTIAKRAIDAAIAGKAPRAADIAAMKNFLR